MPAVVQRGQSGLVFGSGYGTANSDRIVITDATSIQNFSAFTMIGWYYPQANSNWILFQKGAGASNTRKQFTQNGSTGNIQLLVDRATTDSSYITNDTPMATLNKWHLAAATYDASATPTTHIYIGTLTSPAVESTYGTANDGSGSTNNDNTHDLVIGNLALATAAWHGRISHAAYINRAISLSEVRLWQFKPQLLPGCRGFWVLGGGHSRQDDLSGNGNHGAITGATLGRGVPSRPPRRWRKHFIYQPAAAATAVGRIVHRVPVGPGIVGGGMVA